METVRETDTDNGNVRLETRCKRESVEATPRSQAANPHGRHGSQRQGPYVRKKDGSLCSSVFTFSVQSRNAERLGESAKKDAAAANSGQKSAADGGDLRAEEFPGSIESALQTLQLMLGDDDVDGDVTSSPRLGKLHFSVSYDFNKQSLVTQIHEAQDLPAKDANGTSDPYVKVKISGVNGSVTLGEMD